jgi:hypothetical protein
MAMKLQLPSLKRLLGLTFQEIRNALNLDSYSDSYLSLFSTYHLVVNMESLKYPASITTSFSKMRTGGRFESGEVRGN